MPTTTNRNVPNPQSAILKQAIIGGAGLGLPQNITIPEGMGAILLYVPKEHITQSIIDIQKDIGLPWFAEGVKEGVWLDELHKAGK